MIDTVVFSPEHDKIPVVSNQESSINTALDMLYSIYKPSPTALFASIGASKLQAISKLMDIFKQNTTPHKSPHGDTSQTRVKVKHNNPYMKNASLRVKLPSNLPAPAPSSSKNPK